MDEQADFVAKLHQIEETAFTGGSNTRDDAAKAHLRHIGLVARNLRLRIEMGVAIIAASPKRPSGDPGKKHPG